MQHVELANSRWFTMTLAEQLGNVGSEYSRAVTNRNRNEIRFKAAQIRFLELLDLTIIDPRWNVFRKRELLRLRENCIETFPSDLQKYFDQFALLARLNKNVSES